MANLNKDIVGSLPIPLPPKELQDKFANSLAEVEILRANIDREVLILDTLFASLQHRAFRGEL
jgi:type I restriction enzyme S subunit